MLTSAFDYNLPQELIAQEPPIERGTSRMMVIHRAQAKIEHRRIADLPEYLTSEDLLVLNDTRVFPARLQGVWADTGGALELLLLEEQPLPFRPTINSPHVACWSCLTGSGRPVRQGQRALFADGALTAEILLAQQEATWLVCFHSTSPLMTLLEQHGLTPVPPYIQRSGDLRQTQIDRERYQTIYAREIGAVAAPTAGLHFTQQLFMDLERQGVRRTTVTLHVGPGTFKPVKSDTLEAHRMDAERYSVSSQTAMDITACRQRNGRIIAVGSTTVRTLESVAATHHGKITAATDSSTLFIYPPYQFQVTDAMLTNFHLPRSTLLMMVSALAGQALIMRAYQEAIQQKYRFFSYGDCMLII